MAAVDELIVQLDLYNQREVSVTPVGGTATLYPAEGIGEIVKKHLVEYPDDADLPYTLTSAGFVTALTVSLDAFTNQRMISITSGGVARVYPAEGIGEIARKWLVEYPDDADLPYTLT